AQLRQEMRREIRALQQKLGITMVYVTHDQTEAMSMADRVVLLNAGSIEQNDTPDRLYGQPCSEFAARFIGTPPMNLLILDDETTAGLRDNMLSSGAPPQARKLGVRPEHIHIVSDSLRAKRTADAPTDSRPDGAVATIETVEYFGVDSIVFCRLGSNSGIAVRIAGHAPTSPGERIMLRWSATQQHFFDASGQALHQAPALTS